MEIIFHGHACFTVKTKNADIVFNPNPEAKKLKGDMVFCGMQTPEYAHIDSVATADPYVVDWPGEYDKNDVIVEGYSTPSGREGEQNTIFTINVEGINICHLSHINESPSPEILEHLQMTDILIIPCGGGTVLDAKAARVLAEKIEARITIPCDCEDPSEFLKEMGVANESQSSLKITQKDLPEDDAMVVSLEKK